MSIPSLEGNIGDVTQTKSPIVVTASFNATSMDKQGWGSTKHIVNIGESGDSWDGSNYFDIIIEDSADNSTFAVVTDSTKLNGTMTTLASGIIDVFNAEAEDNALSEIEYIGDKRFSRIVVTATGSHSTGTPISSTAFNFNPRYAGSVGGQPSF